MMHTLVVYWINLNRSQLRLKHCWLLHCWRRDTFKRYVLSVVLRRSTMTYFLQIQSEYAVEQLCNSSFWTNTVMPLLFVTIPKDEKHEETAMMKTLLDVVLGSNPPVGVTMSRLLRDHSVSLFISWSTVSRTVGQVEWACARSRINWHRLGK